MSYSSAVAAAQAAVPEGRVGGRRSLGWLVGLLGGVAGGPGGHLRRQLVAAAAPVAVAQGGEGLGQQVVEEGRRLVGEVEEGEQAAARRSATLGAKRASVPDPEARRHLGMCLTISGRLLALVADDGLLLLRQLVTRGQAFCRSQLQR